MLIAAAAPAHAESLSDVIAYSYDNNPGIQAQRAALRALDETYVQARASYGPTISASAGMTSYELRRRPFPTADAETENIGLTVQQPLYTGGRLAARLGAAEAQIRGGREQLRRAELDLLQRVVGAYASVRRDEQLLFLARDSVKVLERALSDNEARAKVRTVTMTDVQQSRARLAQARTQAIAVEEQLAASRAQYFAIVGKNPGSLEELPPLDALPKTIDEAFNAAEANSPQLLTAVYAEAASRARLAGAKAQAMPQVAARFEMQRTPTNPYSNGQYDNSRSASVVVSQPLFTSGQISSTIRQATEENNRDRLSLDDARLQVIQTVTQNWERVVSLRRQSASLEDELRANELAFYGIRQEERYALRSNIEVLNASAELSASQQNLARARAAEYVARVQLLSAIGVLTPNTLSPAARAYDPVENFKRVRNRGQTPLEWPVRALDSVASPQIPNQKTPTIPPVRPTGSAAVNTPDAERPVRSTYELLDREPSLGDSPPRN